MGRHAVPEQSPPPRDKPRYRFVLAFGAIFLLAFASMAIVAAVFPERGPQAQASGDAGNPFPPIAPAQTITVNPSSGDVSTPGPDNPTVNPPPPANPPTVAAGAVTGAFAVSQDWNDGFIGTVALSNSTDRAQPWVVRLVFPDIVGALQTSWIAGGPGGSTSQREGQTVTFTGTEPLARGARIGLSFQFAKGPGAPSPRSCLVNANPCIG